MTEHCAKCQMVHFICKGLTDLGCDDCICCYEATHPPQEWGRSVSPTPWVTPNTPSRWLTVEFLLHQTLLMVSHLYTFLFNTRHYTFQTLLQLAILPLLTFIMTAPRTSEKSLRTIRRERDITHSHSSPLCSIYGS